MNNDKPNPVTVPEPATLCPACDGGYHLPLGEFCKARPGAPATAGGKALTLERLGRIKVLHEEFQREGMLDKSWGDMAHEHRAQLLDEVARLRDSLSKIQWQKDCGCDSIDPLTRQMINHPDVERDAMYRIATEAIGPSRCALDRPVRP